MRVVSVTLAIAVVAASCILSREGGQATTTDSGGGGSSTGGDLSGVGGSVSSPATGGQAGMGGLAMGGAGGTGGNGGEGGAGGNGCVSVGTADYDILALGTGTIVIDGICNETAWAAANQVPLASGMNFTDNTGGCRLLWEEGSPDKIYGCCEILDTRLEALISADDTDNIWNDDAVEYHLKGDLTPVRDALTNKSYVNILGTKRDDLFPGGTPDSTFDGNLQRAVALIGTLNTGASDDTSYTLEWSHELVFDASDELIGLCDLVIDDRDTGTRTVWHTFSTSGLINDPTVWGTCKYACTPAN